jgi:hypothetical protein
MNKCTQNVEAMRHYSSILLLNCAVGRAKNHGPTSCTLIHIGKPFPRPFQQSYTANTSLGLCMYADGARNVALSAIIEDIFGLDLVWIRPF